jgi:hypothetical protein
MLEEFFISEIKFLSVYKRDDLAHNMSMLGILIKMLQDKDVLSYIDNVILNKNDSIKKKDLKIAINNFKEIFTYIYDNNQSRLLDLIFFEPFEVNEKRNISGILEIDIGKYIVPKKNNNLDFLGNFKNVLSIEKKEESKECIYIFDILLNDKISIEKKQVLLFKLLEEGTFFNFRSKENYTINEFVLINGKDKINDKHELDTLFLSPIFLKNEIEEKEKMKSLESSSDEKENKLLSKNIGIKEYCELDKNNIDLFKKRLDDFLLLEDVREQDLKIIKYFEEESIYLINNVKYLNKDSLDIYKEIENEQKNKKMVKKVDLEKNIDSFVIKPLEKYSKFQNYKIKELEKINNLVKEKIKEIEEVIFEEKKKIDFYDKEISDMFLYKEEILKILKNIESYKTKKEYSCNVEEKENNIVKKIEMNKYLFEEEKVEKIKERLQSILKIVDVQIEQNDNLKISNARRVLNAEDAIYGLYPVFESSLDNYLKYKKQNDIEDKGYDRLSIDNTKDILKNISHKIKGIFKKSENLINVIESTYEEKGFTKEEMIRLSNINKKNK